MGNNNVTASLTEEESSKSPLEPVSIETTFDHVFLAGEGKDGDIEKERSPDGVGTPETEPQSGELVEDLQVKKVEEEMQQSVSESLGMETVEQLQKQKSVAKGADFVPEAKEGQELCTIGNENVVSQLITTDFGDEEKPCVIGTNVCVTQSIYETAGTEEVMISESLEKIVPAEEVVELAQEMEFSEPGEILNLDYQVVDEVTKEVKADQAISKQGTQETSDVQNTGLDAFKEEKDMMESQREASLKRMIRCRSLPVSHNIRAMGDSLAQQLVSEVAFPSRNKIGFEKPNTSETLLVSCAESKKPQETTEAILESNKEETIAESNKEAKVEIRSSSSGNDIKLDASTEKTPLLCQDKTETYEATIAVEEKTVMLKRSETDKTRGMELSLGLSMKPSERSDADDTFKEAEGSGDNFLDKKACLDSMKGRVRKRSKSSLLGTCLCCNAAMN